MQLKIKSPLRLLQIFLGIVFIAAGLYRIFNFSLAEQELLVLSLPVFLVIPLVLFEVIGGVLLVLDRYTKQLIYAFTSFLILAVIIAFITNFSTIITGFKDLFFFNPTATDVFLHLTYIFMLVVLLVSIKKNGKKR